MKPFREMPPVPQTLPVTSEKTSKPTICGLFCVYWSAERLRLPLIYRNFDGISDGTWWLHHFYTVNLERPLAKSSASSPRRVLQLSWRLYWVGSVILDERRLGIWWLTWLMWQASLVSPLGCHIVWLKVADRDSVNIRFLSGFSSTCHLYHFFLS